MGSTQGQSSGQSEPKTYQESVLGQGFVMASNVLLHGYKNLKPQDKLCYLLLAQVAELSWQNRRVDKNGRPYIWVGQKYLREELGVGEFSLRQSLKRLTEAGLIKQRRRGLSLTNLTYVYVVDPNNKDFLKWRESGGYKLINASNRG